MGIKILAIESSCDDTSAAVLDDSTVLSNVLANQEIHSQYGGVVPELASRAHQQNIVPVVERALKIADINITNIDAIAFTRGPGLLGSLLVGISFVKGVSLAINKPIIDVNHIQGHLLAPFINEPNIQSDSPTFPYLSLLVSGGHTLIVRVDDYLDYKIIGETIDDAVGEAFDKCAKLLNLGYPGGPIVDRISKEGDDSKFIFAKPQIPGYNYSFSGVKTSLLYFLRDSIAADPDFIEKNLTDICASYQKNLIDILLNKLVKAAKENKIFNIALGGGVSANSLLRKRVILEGEKRGWKVFLPEFKYTTDNAAMIGIVGYYKFKYSQFSNLDITPVSRLLDYNEPNK